MKSCGKRSRPCRAGSAGPAGLAGCCYAAGAATAMDMTRAVTAHRFLMTRSVLTHRWRQPSKRSRPSAAPHPTAESQGHAPLRGHNDTTRRRCDGDAWLNCHPSITHGTVRALDYAVSPSVWRFALEIADTHSRFVLSTTVAENYLSVNCATKGSASSDIRACLHLNVRGSEAAMWRLLRIFRPTTNSRGTGLVDCKKGPTVRRPQWPLDRVGRVTSLHPAPYAVLQ